MASTASSTAFQPGFHAPLALKPPVTPLFGRVLTQAEKKDIHAEIPLKEWLSQFSRGADRRLAKKLYDQLQYVDLGDLRDSAANLHAWLGQQPSIDPYRTAYISLGKGKSGDFFRYLYRQTNGLREKNMVNLDQLKTMKPNEKFDTLVLLDDFIGKGVSANAYLQDYKEELAQYKRVFLLAPVGYTEGAGRLKEKYPNLKVRFDHNLHPLLSPENTQFSAEEKCQIPDFLRRYSDMLPPAPKREANVATGALGFGDFGSMVVFEHNTPNNTPPIFWCQSPDSAWKPIFPRHALNPRPSLKAAPSFAGYYTAPL